MKANKSPYSTPPTPPVAVPAESENADKELPCHRCGILVASNADRCPHCGSRRQFERLHLIVAAILIAAVMFGYMSIMGYGRLISRWELLAVFVVVTFTLVPLLGWIFSKIGGKKW